ncbi:MAG: hypothetical protein ACYCY6_02925 [Minisyncoccota bacterium]
MNSMKEENFKKGLEGLNMNKPSMSVEEETVMLSKIFSTPIKSPYVGKISVFGLTMTRRLQFALIASFIFLLSTSSVVYASGESLPGDLLYPVKISIVEPVLDVVNSGRGKEVDWAEEKVIRRIEEAEKLADKEELTDKQAEAIEKKIEKDSKKLAEILKVSNESDSFKIEEFKKKVNEDRKEEKDNSNKSNEHGNSNEEEDKNKRQDQEEKVKKLKDTAIKSLNSNSGKGNRENKGKND